MVKSIAVVALVALLASPALAQQASSPSPATPGDIAGPTVNQPAQPAANQATAAQQDKEPLICHKMPPPTGTRLGGRTICLTQKQWDQQEKDSQDSLRGVLQRAGGAGGPGAGG